MLWQAMASMRDLGRLHEIASILIRYGFGDLVRRLGLATPLEKAGRALHWRDAEALAHLPPASRARRILEELGPTFIKLGQVLATRVDLFDQEWIDEFSKLLDRAPAVPYTEIRHQLIEDLGAPPEEIFAEFDPVPMAAASIGQVHRARLADGTRVVVKVRRPGIRPTIEADLRWLAKLAELAESEHSELASFHPAEVVRQLAQSLRRELDYTNECRNAERIATRFADYADQDDSSTGDPGEPPIIVIPRVHWQWVAERVCVQEFIDGTPGRDLAAVDKAGLDRRLLARRGARAVLKMIVEDGFFHADPHPGNIFYLPGNRIAFIDFGMMGRLTEERRDQLIRLLVGLVRDDPSLVAEVLMDWTGGGPVDEAGLILEIQAFVDQYHGVPLKQLNLGAMLSDLVNLLRQHRLSLPVDLALLIKAFISLEGMGHELDPDFDMVGEAMPMVEKAMRRRYTPKAVLRRTWKTAGEALTLLAGLPNDLSRLLRAARRGRLEIHIDVTHLRRVGNQLDRAANRITIGIVVAALIIGSSIVMTVPGGPKLFGLPFFGLLGFLIASIGGIWLLISIWRTRKEE
ncbi:ABC1 kinase family protein [Holophaga foetida]|uniref:ABC1 kinase family protein n=1 Tax=Holophaga foetida TaxID=35839 RepID=UPI0002472EE0|nr:AarF/UbiB family protein [Holophaga foetida]